jgi:hypothetical protein
VVLGETGVLLRGAAGQGKSSLALELVRLSAAGGRFARLVADDRVLLDIRGGRVLARPHPQLAGLVERRGLGLTPEAHEAVAVVGLVVDCLGTAPERLPQPEALVVDLGGGPLPRLAVQGLAHDAPLVLAALGLFAAS